MTAFPYLAIHAVHRNSSGESPMTNKPHFSSSEQERISRESMAPLTQSANKLLDLAEQIFRNRVTYDPTNGSDQMALSFLQKQCEHMRSMNLLINASAHRDAALIARIMFEGGIILQWAFANQPERPERWLWFGTVIDWRQMSKNESRGRPVDQEEKDQLQQLLEEHGPEYYRPKVLAHIRNAKTAGTSYEIPEDPWDTKWTTMSIESMSAELGMSQLYEVFYRRTSEWVHWGTKAILQATQSTTWGTSGFSETDWQSASQGLATGCISLLTALRITDEYFSLNRSEEIGVINSELVNSLNALLEPL